MTTQILKELKSLGIAVKRALCYHDWKYDRKDLIGTRYICGKCQRHKHEYIMRSWSQKVHDNETI